MKKKDVSCQSGHHVLLMFDIIKEYIDSDASLSYRAAQLALFHIISKPVLNNFEERIYSILEKIKFVATSLSDVETASLMEEYKMCDEILIAHCRRTFDEKKKMSNPVSCQSGYGEIYDWYGLQRISRDTVAAWGEQFYNNVSLQGEHYYAGLIADCAYMVIPRPMDEIMQSSRKCIVNILISLGRISDLRASEDDIECQQYLNQCDGIVSGKTREIYPKLQILGDKTYISGGGRYIVPHKETDISIFKSMLKSQYTEREIQNAFGGFNKQHSRKRILMENVIGDVSQWA
eukprot:Pgem_evm1s10465